MRLSGLTSVILPLFVLLVAVDGRRTVSRRSTVTSKLEDDVAMHDASVTDIATSAGTAEIQGQQEEHSYEQDEEDHDETGEGDNDQENEDGEELALPEDDEYEDEQEEGALLEESISNETASSIVGDWIGSENWHVEHDYVAYIRIVTKTCTGTVVGNMVVTAAHCMYSKRRPNGLRDGDIWVQLAQWDQTRDKRWVGVKKFIRHPLYEATMSAEKKRKSKTSKKYDIAILWLDTNQDYPNLDTVVFASEGLRTHDKVAIAGFGKTKRGSMGTLHDSGDMKVVNCPRWSNWPDTHKCAGSGPASDRGSCGGDSGGPWYVRKNGKVYIVGVNSFGMGGKCGATSKQTGFTYLGDRAIKQWVEETAPELQFSRV